MPHVPSKCYHNLDDFGCILCLVHSRHSIKEVGTSLKALFVLEGRVELSLGIEDLVHSGLGPLRCHQPDVPSFKAKSDTWS